MRDTGIRLILGWPRTGGGSRVQSVLFDRNLWTLSEARRWLEDHGYKYGSVEATGSYWRFRQEDPKVFSRMRTLKLRRRAANPILRPLLSRKYDLEVTFSDGRPPLRLYGIGEDAVKVVRRIYELDPAVTGIEVVRSSLSGR